MDQQKHLLGRIWFVGRVFLTAWLNSKSLLLISRCRESVVCIGSCFLLFLKQDSAAMLLQRRPSQDDVRHASNIIQLEEMLTDRPSIVGNLVEENERLRAQISQMVCTFDYKNLAVILTNHQLSFTFEIL